MGWNRNDRALRQSTGITVISKASGPGPYRGDPEIEIPELVLCE